MECCSEVELPGFNETRGIQVLLDAEGTLSPVTVKSGWSCRVKTLRPRWEEAGCEDDVVKCFV